MLGIQADENGNHNYDLSIVSNKSVQITYEDMVVFTSPGHFYSLDFSVKCGIVW